MRILITGSSGQIGTNLALRLLADGHEVFGIDKRQNSWTNAFPASRYVSRTCGDGISSLEWTASPRRSR